MGILKILATFDWISPTAGIVNTVSGRASPISCYWSEEPPAYYERILKSHGVRIRAGNTVCSDGFIIMVAQQDKDRAREILREYGVNLA